MYPSRKRTFDNVNSNEVSVIRPTGISEAAASGTTKKSSSAPPAETVTSERVSAPKTSSICPQAHVSNSHLNEVSDVF